MPTPDKNPKPLSPAAIWWPTLGIIIGTSLGIAFDNMGLWLALGVAIGAAGGIVSCKRNNSD